MDAWQFRKGYASRVKYSLKTRFSPIIDWDRNVRSLLA